MVVTSSSDRDLARHWFLSSRALLRLLCLFSIPIKFLGAGARYALLLRDEHFSYVNIARSVFYTRGLVAVAT